MKKLFLLFALSIITISVGQKKYVISGKIVDDNKKIALESATIYLKKIKPGATVQQQIKVGRLTVVAGCVVAVLMAVALDNIKGQSLFYIFQSILGFLAPSLSVVFLLSVFWKRMTKKAVNITLSYGSAFSLLVGLIYLWILPKDGNPYFTWPHPFMLSFDIFAILFGVAILISLTDKQPQTTTETEVLPVTSKKVKWMFALLGILVLSLYLIFNGH